jgi:hypothetical protein
LWAKGLNTKDIYKKIYPVYGGKCLKLTAVHNWVEKFPEQHWNVTDDDQSGRPFEIVTVAIVLQLAEELIRVERSITIDSVVTSLGCSHGLAYSIMHDHLKFRKVCAQWVPRELKDREKVNRMGLSLQHLLRYAIEGKYA